MAITAELKPSYDAVLKDLEAERNTTHQEVVERQRKLKELDFSIATLYRRIGSPQPLRLHLGAGHRNQSPDQKYAFISVRWAILDLLNDSSTPLSTADIADTLKAYGVKTKAVNFTNNVSAVLSTTMRETGQEEVEIIDGKWRLTERGRSAIAHIRMTPKFLQSCPWAASEVGPAAVTH